MYACSWSEEGSRTAIEKRPITCFTFFLPSHLSRYHLLHRSAAAVGRQVRMRTQKSSEMREAMHASHRKQMHASLGVMLDEIVA